MRRKEVGQEREGREERRQKATGQVCFNSGTWCLGSGGESSEAVFFSRATGKTLP